MKTSDFNYNLPIEYIAQKPIEPRDRSRLMVLSRKTNQIEHRTFNQIGDYLTPGDVLVLNETRVIPARLFAQKLPGRGRVEILLLRRLDSVLWEVIVGGKGLKLGRRVQILDGPQAEIVDVREGAHRIIRFDVPIEKALGHAGHVPLPPYITEPLSDPEQYQTIFAKERGSAAAPTAGLHFTQELLTSLIDQGIKVLTLTLHIGLDTFAPVNEENPLEHKIHSEWCQLSPEAASAINSARSKGNRIIAVGTTTVRTLETAAKNAKAGEVVGSFEGPTDLFILPGYQFSVVDGLITNFHLPKSTLIMLVSAFASREKILSAYEIAKQESYRFYSFGDAMLII